uniref:EF-hand domain-containing protein n=1 Tax=Hemiselmis andersenii TaxID=464988 RepID=A0A6U5BNI5_HEMAN|mmetsp:Transcript_56834/g.137386  ORF Transcript_56834/g.137386 Transcript_56834/m.137386 type:complete len:725 (+) Transcript_56834:244-2418(+)
MAASAAAATVAKKRGEMDAFLKRHGNNVVGGVYKLRGLNEELNENDLAHEGFGTVEDKYAEKPLIGYLPNNPKDIIRNETCLLLQDRKGGPVAPLPGKEAKDSDNYRVTDRRFVLTHKVLAIGAEYDSTGEVKADSIPLFDIVEARALPEDHGVIEIITQLEGHNSGRTYRFRPPSSTVHGWLHDLQMQSIAAIEHKNSKIRKYRRIIRHLYAGGYVQLVIATMIIMNFLMLCAESQLQPDDGDQIYKNIQALDLTFTVIFTVELFVNAVIHWFYPFINNGWNVLDIIVITIAWIAKAGNIAQLEPTRAFRIFRLAGKVESLRRIVTAITKAIIPMCYAFFIAGIFTSIFAVLGTEFYKERDPENFGTFSRTMYTLWYAVAFSTWRNDLPIWDEQGNINWGILLYLVSMVVILMWVTLQIVVAVLLDNFVGATKLEHQKEAKKRLLEAEQTNIDTGGLEPLLTEMLKLFDTSDQLSRGIKKIFHNLDHDRQGTIDFTKMMEGMKKFATHSTIRLTPEDYEVLIEGGRMCNPDRTINEQQFDQMMRKQIKQHVQRDLTDVMGMNEYQIEMRVLLASHRILHVNDQYDEIRTVQGELAELYKEVNLMRIKCLTDTAQLVALSEGAADASRDMESNAQNIDAILDRDLAVELRARHAQQQKQMAEMREIVADLKNKIEQSTNELRGKTPVHNGIGSHDLEGGNASDLASMGPSKFGHFAPATPTFVR